MLPVFFFFNDTATTEIYTLSLHDALPIYLEVERRAQLREEHVGVVGPPPAAAWPGSIAASSGRRTGSTPRSCPPSRSEEHTSELQSRQYLVCRLLLEKKKTN